MEYNCHTVCPGDFTAVDLYMQHLQVTRECMYVHVCTGLQGWYEKTGMGRGTCSCYKLAQGN